MATPSVTTDWLTARPVAHRGLHDAAAGIIENTPSAFEAAIAGNYAIECDVQLSADGDAMVFHDAALDRLTKTHGPLGALTRADLKQVAFKATADRMLTLAELCALVAGRVTLVVEVKSAFDGDARLARRAAAVLAAYAGPVAAMSFDPFVVEALRHAAPTLRRGMVAERHYKHGEAHGLAPGLAESLGLLAHASSTQPHFVAYHVHDLPQMAPQLAERLPGLPLLAWTVRSEADRQIARQSGAQIIFEGFRA